MPTMQDSNAFFREGLIRYADARETVTYYQTCVQDAIARAFEVKATWTHFQPVRSAPEQSLEVVKAAGVVFLHSYVAGIVSNRHENTKVWLLLGLYWNPPFRSGSVVAASQCSIDGSGPIVPFNVKNLGDGISCGPLYKRSERRVFLVADDTFDPVVSFGALLDAADVALGPLDGASTPPDSVQVG